MGLLLNMARLEAKVNRVKIICVMWVERKNQRFPDTSEEYLEGRADAAQGILNILNE